MISFLLALSSSLEAFLCGLQILGRPLWTVFFDAIRRGLVVFFFGQPEVDATVHF
jgi:hypothetical protein